MKQLLRPLFYGILLLLAAAIATSTCVAQRAPLHNPNTLLWRITGNGLSEPSYLYGTMHLTDSRLFDFGDSLYRAIEKTDGLAIEVNPDEMAAYFVNKMLDQVEHGKKLDELLGKKYIENHREALKKKFKKPVEEISSSDILKEKNKWMEEFMKKGEMPTFMDAYLYNIARRQGKWLGGIEDIGDQASLMDDMIDQSDVDYLLEGDKSEAGERANSSIEEMIKLYTAGDLDGIDQLFNKRYDGELKDRLLIRRNVKMARRMDSLSSIRTMLFAVGCAHLPGDSGVIELLRKRGFTLEPVFPGKRIPAKNYSFKEVHLPWTDVADADGYYTAQMPANPATVKLFGMVEMKFLLDIFNMSGFCTAAIPRATKKGPQRDSLFANVVRRMFHGEKAPTPTVITRNGVEGKEYVYTGDDGNIRVQLYADDKTVYMAMLSGLKKEMLRSADADTFFRSFTILPHHVSSETTAMVFVDSIMGISFASPAKISRNDKLGNLKDDTWKMTAFTGMDSEKGAMIVVMSREIKAGYYISDESSLEGAMDQMLEQQYKNIRKDSTEVDHRKLMQYTAQNINQPELFLQAVSAIKDGRQTIIMVIGDTADRTSTAITNIFESFHFIGHPPVSWQMYGAPDESFDYYGPTPARELRPEDVKTLHWVAYDTTTATSYSVIPDTLDKYTWYTSDSVFWETLLARDTARQIIVECKKTMNGTLEGREYITKESKNGALYTRSRLLLSGNILFKLFVSGELSLLRSPETDKFFSTFRPRHPELSTVTRSKAALLLKDLSSVDSATSAAAESALYSANFGKEDAGLLREAVFKKYKTGRDTTLNMYVNNTLARDLGGLRDTATVSFIKFVYPALPDDSVGLRNVALSVLAHQPDAYSYATLGELLKQGPTKEVLSYDALNGLMDSLQLAAMIYPALYSWAKDTANASGVARVAVKLVDSGLLSKETLAAQSAPFIKAARSYLPEAKAKSAYPDIYMNSLLELLGKCGTPAALATLRDYCSVKNHYLLHQTVLVLLDAKQTVAPAVMRRLAADADVRTMLYDDLKERKKTAIFPKEYLTQPAFALSAVYDEIENEDREVDTVIYVGKRTATYKGKTYLFYLYKASISSDDEKAFYLAIAGGYDVAGTGLKPKKVLTGVYFKKEYDKASVDKFFKAYLKEFDEDVPPPEDD